MPGNLSVQPIECIGMKAIRHAGVDGRMTVLDDQAPTNESPLPIITSMQHFTHHGLCHVCLKNPVMGQTLH